MLVVDIRRCLYMRIGGRRMPTKEGKIIAAVILSPTVANNPHNIHIPVKHLLYCVALDNTTRLFILLDQLD